MTRQIATEDSLTLDLDARTRAAEALSDAIEGGSSRHWCADWDEGDGCTICWDIAAQVVRAAEGLGLCQRCGGGGDVGQGAHSSCPECGGNGLTSMLLEGSAEQDG